MIKYIILIKLIFLIWINRGCYSQDVSVKTYCTNAIEVFEYFKSPLGLGYPDPEPYSYCRTYIVTDRNDTIQLYSSMRATFWKDYPKLKEQLGKKSEAPYVIPNPSKFQSEYITGSIFEIKSHHIYKNLSTTKRFIAYRVKVKIHIFTGIDLVALEKTQEINISPNEIPCECRASPYASVKRFATYLKLYKYSPLKKKDIRKYGLEKLAVNSFSITTNL